MNNYEELSNELELIINQLETNKLSLEDSIDKYKRALDITNKLNEILESAKKVLVENNEAR